MSLTSFPIQTYRNRDLPFSSPLANQLIEIELASGDPAHTTVEALKTFITAGLSSDWADITNKPPFGALSLLDTVSNDQVSPGANIAWTKIDKSGAVAGDVGAATAAQGALADTAVQPGDLGDLALLDTVDYDTEVTNKPALGALALLDTVSNDQVSPSANIAWTKIDKTGATPGDVGAATAAQGALADTAVQPGDLGVLALLDAVSNDQVSTGANIAWTKIDKTGAVAVDVGAATVAQGALADTAVQPGDLGDLALLDTVDYDTEVTNKPALGDLALLDTVSDAQVSPSANIAWTKIDKTGATPDDVGAFANPMDQKGQILVQGASGPLALPSPSNDWFLLGDPSTEWGLRWTTLDAVDYSSQIVYSPPFSDYAGLTRAFHWPRLKLGLIQFSFSSASNPGFAATIFTVPSQLQPAYGNEISGLAVESTTFATRATRVFRLTSVTYGYHDLSGGASAIEYFINVLLYKTV